VGKIKIRFHKDLYPAAAIEKAARDFGKITNFNIRKEKDYHLVTIDNSEPDKELLLKGNFLNYVLMLLKAR
jgi:hypothetical protein